MSDASELIDPYIQSLVAAREKTAVVKIRFLSYRAKYPDGILIAVEGNDDKLVYSYWIKRLDESLAYEFYVCGGKRQIAKLRNSLAVDRTGADKNVFFIVDRDFDDLSKFESVDRVFMLDRYSIENYLVDRSVVDETIRVAFPGSGDPVKRKTLCDLFDADFADFLGVTYEINLRVFVARRLSINIDDLIPTSLSMLACVDLGQVESCKLPASEALPLSLDFDTEMVEGLTKEFRDFDPITRYRGKFSYKFLSAWLSKLSDAHRRGAEQFFVDDPEERGKVKAQELSIGPLASRSCLPGKFDQFVNQMRN